MAKVSFDNQAFYLCIYTYAHTEKRWRVIIGAQMVWHHEGVSETEAFVHNKLKITHYNTWRD